MKYLYIFERIEYGYYVGLVASSYFLSQFISSFIWGYLSDLVGRRPGTCYGLRKTLVFIFVGNELVSVTFWSVLGCILCDGFWILKMVLVGLCLQIYVWLTEWVSFHNFEISIYVDILQTCSNLGVTKSYLGEITDSTNQTRAFALTSITFGISSVLGPLGKWLLF